jgi:hypothetical protein
MTELRVQVEGVGVWSPQLTGVDALGRLLDGQALEEPLARPDAATLSINERRRAPESVLVAIEAASQAVAMSRRNADSLACVFASAYGDQATTDYMCRVLAHSPTELSPTRFHNSVHNASAGYWTIATDCRAPSTAVCAGYASFGAALLEAAAQVCADHRPVLLVCSDTASTGPLGEVIDCRIAFGCALVLSPFSEAAALPLYLSLVPETAGDAQLPEPCNAWMRDNPSAACLPLLAVLVRGAGQCVLAASERLGLRARVEGTA